MKKMKKLICMILALIMVFALCACGGASSAPAASAAPAAPAAETTKFIMGIDPEYPPFSYLGDDGKIPVLTWRSARQPATILAGRWRSSA